jgi:hypothetical protein
MLHAVYDHFLGLKRLLPWNLRRARRQGSFASGECGRQEEEELLLLAQSLRNEIRQLILWVASERRGKEDLCVLLKSLLRRYGLLKSRAYRFAINNFISIEAETYCSFRLDAEELILLWTGSG